MIIRFLTDAETDHARDNIEPEISVGDCDSFAYVATRHGGGIVVREITGKHEIGYVRPLEEWFDVVDYASEVDRTYGKEA